MGCSRECASARAHAGSLAGTYKNAVGRELWRGRPGMTWSELLAFLADHRALAYENQVEFGQRVD